MSYSAQDLPAGLKINASTGAITGTVAPGASANGPYSVTIIASDSTYSNLQSFTWEVNNPIKITDPGVQPYSLGESVSLQIEATDSSSGTLKYAAGGLPNGLTINRSTGLISGILGRGSSNAGGVAITITVTDGTFTSIQTVFLWIDAPTTGLPSILSGGAPYSPLANSTDFLDPMSVVGPDSPNAQDKPTEKTQWTKENVLKLLTQSDMGKKTIDTLADDNVVVKQSEFIRSERRAKKDNKWGDWQKFEWGGMTETKGKTRTIHIPANYTDAQAAVLLVHEATHARGGDELAAYTAETQFVIESTDKTVKKLVRDGFIKEVDKKPMANTDRIKEFVEETYKGWYKPDPNVEWKLDGKTIKIDYGKEETITDWKK